MAWHMCCVRQAAPADDTFSCAQAVTGSWRGVLEELAAIEALSPGDVRDAAAATLHSDNCITALVTSQRGA